MGHAAIEYAFDEIAGLVLLLRRICRSRTSRKLLIRGVGWKPAPHANMSKVHGCAFGDLTQENAVRILQEFGSLCNVKY